MKTKTPQEVEAILNEPRNGTNEWHRHWTRALTFTDGVLQLADAAGAHWLVDLIASYQPQCRKDESLVDFQIWVLKVNLKEKTADAYCFRDSINGEFPPSGAIIHQHIEYSDFPLAEVKLWVEQGGPDGKPVLMIPSER